MEVAKDKNNYILYLKSVTWYKDSHSLFDYESAKINTNAFVFPLATTKSVALYRKRECNGMNKAACSVVALDQTQEGKFDPEEYQFLTKFDIKSLSNNKFRLNLFNYSEKPLKKINSERLNTEQSIFSVTRKEEETYIIVRKQKEPTGQPKGCKLNAGQTIKLGRMEFYVSEICIGENVVTAKSNKEKLYANKLVLKYNPNDQKQIQKGACKICLDEAEEPDNFLFNPCKCSGSCGTIHIDCLLQWIRVKVKKEVIGGTLHYNFEKFECEVCKSELPVIIELLSGKNVELLPIEKPKGSYLILEGTCQKSKSVMMIKNVPEGGIKFGRGHECEIRITDISVSRNHAFLKFNGNYFSIFDNKSKFGTLLKQQKMNIELVSKEQQGIQVGRTIVILDICKESQLKEKKQLQGEQKIVAGRKKVIK